MLQSQSHHTALLWQGQSEHFGSAIEVQIRFWGEQVKTVDVRVTQ